MSLGQPVVDFENLDDAELSQRLKSYGIDVGPINVATRRTYVRKLMKLQTGADSPPRYQPVDDDEDSDDEETNRKPPEQTQKSKTDAATSPRYQRLDDDHGNEAEAARETYKEKLSRPETGATPGSLYQPAHINDVDRDIQFRYPSSRPAPVLSELPQPHIRSLRETELSTRVESRPSLHSNRKITTTYGTSVSRPNSTKLPQESSRGCPLWLIVLSVAVALVLSYLIYANMEPAARSNIPGIPNKIEV